MSLPEPNSISFRSFSHQGQSTFAFLDNGDDIVEVAMDRAQFEELRNKDFIFSYPWHDQQEWASSEHPLSGELGPTNFLTVNLDLEPPIACLNTPNLFVWFTMDRGACQHFIRRGWLIQDGSFFRTQSFTPMPIDYSKYCDDWKLRSRFVRLSRANGKCESCGAVHGEPHPITGSKVQLHCAHLDHDISHNSLLNLRALCQRCHARYDAPHHSAQRKKAAFEKKHRFQLSLFDPLPQTI